MRNFGQDSPKEFDATLIQRVVSGLAYVISANEYNSLPTNLKVKYYPLFRRADTTYRLYPQFMRARRDIDPTTQIVHLVPRKAVALAKQVEKNPTIVTQKEILPINPYVSLPHTDLSEKSTGMIAQETQATLNNYVSVRTQFARY
jgi:hypothetical protein